MHFTRKAEKKIKEKKQMYTNIHTHKKKYGRKIRYSRISVGPVALPAAARCLQFTAGDYDRLFLHPFREEPPQGIVVSFGPRKLPPA